MVTNGAGSDTLILTDYINVPEPALLTQLFSGAFGLFVLSGYRKRGRVRLGGSSGDQAGIGER
jgi:hypothetical protein